MTISYRGRHRLPFVDSHFYHGQLTFSRTKGLAETVIKKNRGQLLQVRPQPLYSGGFVYLGIHHSSLANCTGASIGNVVARYQNSSSKLCLSLGSFKPRSLQQTRLHKNYNFWDSYQLSLCQMVLNRDCAFAIPLQSSFRHDTLPWILSH